MPLDLVSQLMLRCDAKGKLLPPKLLKPGDQVTLTKGTLCKFCGRGGKDRAGSARLGPHGTHGVRQTQGCGRGGSAAGGVSKFAVVVGLLQMLLLSQQRRRMLKREHFVALPLIATGVH